ncbi:methyl-accepting chemotaxis protein [soil metagenome]
MMFGNMTMRRRLTVAFGSLALCVLAVSALSLIGLNAGDRRFNDYLEGINTRAKLADDIQMAVDARAIAARNLVLVSSAVDLQIEHAAVVQAHGEVTSKLARLDEMIKAPGVSDEARRMVGEIDRLERAYGPVALAIVDLAVAGKRDEAIRMMNEQCRPLLSALTKASLAYNDYTDNRAGQVTREAEADYIAQRNLLIAACLVAFIAAAACGVWITRGLSRSLGAEPSELSAAARRVAEGHLGRIDGALEAPAGSVLASLGSMQQSLSKIVGQVRGASDSIATGSEQIATGNADLSQRTEEQASALQQTAASMEQLGTTVRQNSESAQQANQLALGASSVATRGGDVVARVVETMRGINDSSRQISDIIGVIDGIAFQTNILALNAAVEAARAGDQGRGFAVVASEVRSLAQRSAAAAREIKTLISTSVERVGQGSTLVDQAGATMNEIVASIRQVTDIMAEISAASREQSAGVAQVGDAVGQMDQTTQQNAALVEQSAAAAEGLRTQAEELVRAVAVFKLA